MDLSIVILNYKQKGLLKQCLKGIILAQPQLDYEIIVVDNKSDDGSLEMVKEIFLAKKDDNQPQLKLPITKPLAVPPIQTIQADVNNGFAAGNNLGIAKALGKYVMILNPDVAIVSGVLEKMVDFMQNNSDVGMIGPRLINPDGSTQYSCRRFPGSLVPVYRRTIFGKLPFAKKIIDSYLMLDFDHENNRLVDWLFGACLVIRKSALDKVGSFDEKFFMYFEDLDLCRRFWQQNFKVLYFAGAEMVHYHQQWSTEKGGIFGVLRRGGRVHVASGIKYFIKYFGTKIPVKN
ncbi:MAG: glycosyltransferase family 2 protein [Candidatus Buchananbacteria bacterium]